ncbi:MAG: hypothetical protein AB8G15_11575 [Saprospiraceae bacterium]
MTKKMFYPLFMCLFALLLFSCGKESNTDLVQGAKVNSEMENAVIDRSNEGEEDAPIMCCITVTYLNEKAYEDHDDCYYQANSLCYKVVVPGGNVGPYYYLFNKVEEEEIKLEEESFTTVAELAIHKEYVKLSILEHSDQALYEGDDYFTIDEDGYLEIEGYEFPEDIQKVYLKKGEYEMVPSEKEGVYREFRIAAEVE